MTRSAQHQFHRTLRPIGKAVVGHDIDPLCQLACRRIADIQRKTMAGAYLLADEIGNVYVLADESRTTGPVVDMRTGWLVGLYLSATPDQLRADLIEHFCESGFVSDTHIMGAIRDVEG